MWQYECSSLFFMFFFFFIPINVLSNLNFAAEDGSTKAFGVVKRIFRARLTTQSLCGLFNGPQSDPNHPVPCRALTTCHQHDEEGLTEPLLFLLSSPLPSNLSSLTCHEKTYSVPQGQKQQTGDPINLSW